MKFTRRHDLDPQTRIEIVKDVWINQGIYGKMTQIAQDYHISRTFLYQLSWAAKHHLEYLFSDPQYLIEPSDFLLEPWILVLRLEGQCSIPSISSIFKHFDYQPSSVGSLSQYLKDYGRSVPSTLRVAEKKMVFYLSDEIFAIGVPILVTLEAQSTAILKIELASDRSAETWEAHFKDLDKHLFHSIGMASDRGVGLMTGYQAACQDGRWVCDQFHEFQELFHRCQQLERKAYGAIGKEMEAVALFHNAKSEANLQKRLEQYERSHQACEQAMARYDQLSLLLQWLRETLHLCSPLGRLRTVEGVRSDLLCLLDMIQEVDDEKLAKRLKPIRSHLDDILVPFEQQFPEVNKSQESRQPANWLFVNMNATIRLSWERCRSWMTSCWGLRCLLWCQKDANISVPMRSSACCTRTSPPSRMTALTRWRFPWTMR